MNIFACPTCHAQQSVPAESAGKLIPCTKCGAQMAIPVMQTAAVQQPSPAASVSHQKPEKPIHSQVPMKRRRRIIPYIVLAVIFAIIVVAFFTNPTEDQFWQGKKIDKRSLMEQLEEKILNGGILEDAVLQKPEFRSKNMFIYSIGTYTRRNRLGEVMIHAEFIGAFGKWWTRYPINVSGRATKL